MIPYKPYVCGKRVESILGTRKNMTKIVFNLNNTIPHSVPLVDPFCQHRCRPSATNRLPRLFSCRCPPPHPPLYSTSSYCHHLSAVAHAAH
jgi:hypothetical protein